MTFPAPLSITVEKSAVGAAHVPEAAKNEPVVDGLIDRNGCTVRGHDRRRDAATREIDAAVLVAEMRPAFGGGCGADRSFELRRGTQQVGRECFVLD